MRTQYALLVIGVMLMAWGGSSVESHIGSSGWARADLAIFAIGLMLIARSYVVSIETRVAKLEAALKASARATVP